MKPWSKCYHSYGYPVTTFARIDDVNTSSANTSSRMPCLNEEPLANSTMLDSSMPQTFANLESQTNSCPLMEANTCLRNPANCDSNSRRNLNVSHDTRSISSRNSPNDMTQMGTNLSPRNPIIGSECHKNLRSRNSADCDSNSCPRNPNVTTDSHVHYGSRNSENDFNDSQHRYSAIQSHANPCPKSSTKQCSVNEDFLNDSSCDVGHISHIPRTPPTPTTYTIPIMGQNISSTCRTCGSCGTGGHTQNLSSKRTQNPNLSMSMAGGTTFCEDESLFGMISLKENDVCYTSGTIEWVGRKRSYPLNTGFKVINDSCKYSNANESKKKRKLDHTFTVGMDSTRECECTDMLPTVNAIVDHLNALHEAVDLVDLRLSNLEETQ